MDDDGVELTDLFLDLWVSPDLRYKVLDEVELENALQNGWITKQLYDRAEKEMKKLVSIVKRGKFPSCYVISLEEKLFL